MYVCALLYCRWWEDRYAGIRDIHTYVTVWVNGTGFIKHLGDEPMLCACACCVGAGRTMKKDRVNMLAIAIYLCCYTWMGEGYRRSIILLPRVDVFHVEIYGRVSMVRFNLLASRPRRCSIILVYDSIPWCFSKKRYVRTAQTKSHDLRQTARQLIFVLCSE